nr:MAG TPA: hypothetical protein [Caudoviricetes sp.]
MYRHKESPGEHFVVLFRAIFYVIINFIFQLNFCLF